MSANFTPNIGPYGTLRPFRFWCQKILPLVYDDSLSYMELLSKTVDYLNKTMEDVNTVTEDMAAMLVAFNQLQGYVNEYFNNLDITTEVEAILDKMAENGELSVLISPFVQEFLPDVVDSQIDEVVANQLYAVVASQIVDAAGEALASLVPDIVTDWLAENVDPTGDTTVVLDRSLLIENAAAESKTTGDRIRAAENEIDQIKNGMYESIWTKTDVSGLSVLPDLIPTKIDAVSPKSADAHPTASTPYITIGSTSSNLTTYAFIATQRMTIYIDIADYQMNTLYYALCVGKNPAAVADWRSTNDATAINIDCSECLRMRRTSGQVGDLPTQGNPYTIEIGDVVVISITSTKTPYFWVQSVTEKKDGYLNVTNNYENNALKSVKIKGSRYGVLFVKDTSTYNSGAVSYTRWNIKECYGSTNENILEGSMDIIGPVRVQNLVNEGTEENPDWHDRSGFIGGVHGREQFEEMKIVSGGEDVENGWYREITFIMKSILYSDLDSITPWFERYIQITFNEFGWICTNTIKVIKADAIKSDDPNLDNPIVFTDAYLSGLFGTDQASCDIIFANNGIIDYSSTLNRQLTSNFLKRVEFNLTNNTTIDIMSDTADVAWFQRTYRGTNNDIPTWKIYFDNGVGSQALKFGDITNPEKPKYYKNDILSGTVEYRFA